LRGDQGFAEHAAETSGLDVRAVRAYASHEGLKQTNFVSLGRRQVLKYVLGVVWASVGRAQPMASFNIITRHNVHAQTTLTLQEDCSFDVWVFSEPFHDPIRDEGTLSDW
jgi:hypothetical protein